MTDTILYNEYTDYSPDDKVWLPIPKEEYSKFDKLIDNVISSFKSGSKMEKGNSLEHLMTYIYSRFKHIRVYHNVRKSDNQIDHILEFIDGVTPSFIKDNIGIRLIGESKNHKKSISPREVSNLDELLRDNKSRLGVFSSYKTFSKGKTLWVNAEGKRRKLALWNQYNRIIIGFTITELSTLKEKNFYSLLKQKFDQVIDELDDCNTDDSYKLPYNERLFNSLSELHQKGIIDQAAFELGQKQIESKYGELNL